jgi:putative sigma-54 modulation protein
MVDKEKFRAEEALGYNISILGRSVMVTEAMKNYVWEKLTKVERLHNHIMDAHVIMDIQKLEHNVTVVLKFEHFKVKVSASSTDMYASIDKAIEKLQAKFIRWKERIQDHHKKKLSTIDMVVNIIRRPADDLSEINAEIEAENRIKEKRVYQAPRVIKQEKKILKTLTTDEAIMKMELSDDSFLIFRDEVDHNLKVIYRRSDGDYAIIQTA